MSTSAGGLLERERELGVLRGLVDEAAAGRGGVVVFEGDPGVGKSALVRELAATAAAAGLKTHSASGGALEREYPFGLVRQLFELELAGADEERRRRLLAGAAAQAAPVVGAAAAGELAGGQDSSFSTLHGLYWLTAALAEERPLLLSLDDAHWADAPSLRFVDFLARRIGELPVLVAVAARPQEPGAETELIDAIAESAAATVIRPGSFSLAAVAELIAARLGERAGEGVAEAAHLATGGNPLLLTELVAALAEGEGPVSAATVTDAVPSSVSRSVGRRLARLPEPAGTVASALATLGERDGGELLETASGLDPATIAAGLTALREAGLVEAESDEFVHPLIRQAIAQRVGPQQRNAVHAAAARALRERGGSEERVIVHLLAAPPLGESWAGEVLQRGAARALAEGAPEAAVSRLSRAVEEAPGEVPPELLLQLGRAQLGTGDPDAGAHLEAAARAEDPALAAEALVFQIVFESLSGAPGAAGVVERLRAAVVRLGDDAPPDLINALMGSLIVASTIDGTIIDSRLELFADPRFRELPVVTGLTSFEGACGEMARDEVLELARQTLRTAPLTELTQLENPHSWWSIGALGLVDAGPEADAAITEAETGARRHGSRLAHAYVTTVRAQIAIPYGSVAIGEANAWEAVDLWREIGLGPLAETSYAQLVYALVLRDRAAEAEALLPKLGEPEGLFPRGQALVSRSQLRAAQGRSAEAVADLREVAEIAERLRHRQFGWGFTRVLLAQALIADGQAEEGLELARAEEATAREAGRPSQQAAALVAIAAAGEGDDELGALEAAVAVPGVAAPLARARARVELGAALRRRGLRKDARTHLREGQEIAGRASLRALEQRALEELVVAGGRPRSPYSSGVEALTPSELRTAKLAAAGLTNREVAEALFVTRKTVELHLGNAYGKLGIRSRAQLPEALGEGAAAKP